MVSLVKVVIPGGSGHLGRLLARSFARDGHDVVILSRRRTAVPWRVVEWDAVSLGAWTAELEQADVLINLVGRSVNCRYTPAHRREILDSRIMSTRVLGDAVARAARPPRVWLQSSTATIYAHRYDAANDEATGVLGGTEPDVPETWNFSIDVATKWEREFRASTPGTRKVAMRSAIVMSPRARRPVRRADAARPARARRHQRRRTAIRVVDPRRRLCSSCAVAPGSDRHLWRRESRRADTLAERRFHARPSPRVGHIAWSACARVAPRNWGVVHAHRDRARAQEPARRLHAAARSRICILVARLAGRCA